MALDYGKFEFFNRQLKENILVITNNHPELGVRGSHKKFHRYALQWIFRPTLVVDVTD